MGLKLKYISDSATSSPGERPGERAGDQVSSSNTVLRIGKLNQIT